MIETLIRFLSEAEEERNQLLLLEFIVNFIARLADDLFK